MKRFHLFIIALWQTRAKAAFVKVRQAISVVNSKLQQNITGVRIVQSFNREERNAKIFDGVNDDHLQANIKAIKLSSALMPTVEFVTAISLLVSLKRGCTAASITPGSSIGSSPCIFTYMFDLIRRETSATRSVPVG